MTYKELSASYVERINRVLATLDPKCSRAQVAKAIDFRVPDEATRSIRTLNLWVEARDEALDDWCRQLTDNVGTVPCSGGALTTLPPQSTRDAATLPTLHTQPHLPLP